MIPSFRNPYSAAVSDSISKKSASHRALVRTIKRFASSLSAPTATGKYPRRCPFIRRCSAATTFLIITPHTL
nr:hypothetical protein Itr_chr01CG17490 [Ipomoea trifida]